VEKMNLTDLFSQNLKLKYGCARNLLAIAKENPSEIYPNLDFFVKLLDSENKIIKWTAIDIIGHLAKVDKAKKIDELVRRLFELLNAGNLITANHAITALTGIALAKPKYQGRITDELLKVEHYSYNTDECRNIAIGTVILAIGSYFSEVKDKGPTIEFVRRQTQNGRNATRRKAGKFLRKYGQSN
jgi:hypothetical protein